MKVRFFAKAVNGNYNITKSVQVSKLNAYADAILSSGS